TALLLVPAPATMPDGAWTVVALAARMALWWSTEALPVPATALLPLLVLPATGIGPLATVAPAYSHPLIFLFLGGFMVALAVQRWNLHRRLALAIILRIGVRPPRLIAGVMLVTGFLSMWVSNTATAMLMLPIALSVLDEIGDDDGGLTLPLLLAIAYGASIGGLATLIGTPPNAILAAFVEETYGLAIGFAQWMAVALPISLVLGLLTWLILTRLVTQRSTAAHLAARRGGPGRDVLRQHLDRLGPPRSAEKRVAAVFVTMAILWVCRPLLSGWPPLAWLNDTTIALVAGLALFLIPSGNGRPLLVWSDTGRLPWGTLLLFGGGLALADAIVASGLATWIGTALNQASGWNLWLLVGLIVTIMVFATELTSNTAAAATLLPLIGALAVTAGANPLFMMVPAALAASAAFMLPVATPPNAIVHGSGRLSVTQMAAVGFTVNLAAILVLSLILPWLTRWIFGA
ncbi:MAG: DASS family sodium-coupled anion symporter, partial [Alphaproteobacteria bacterium]